MFSHLKTSVIPCNLKKSLEMPKAFYKLNKKLKARGGGGGREGLKVKEFFYFFVVSANGFSQIFL